MSDRLILNVGYGADALSPKGRFETYELNLVHVIAGAERSYARARMPRRFSGPGYHEDGDMLQARYVGSRGAQVEYSRRSTLRWWEPDLTKLTARNNGAALDFNSRRDPTLLLEELQEGARRYLAATVRQQEAGACDLVVLEQEDAGFWWCLQCEAAHDFLDRDLPQA